MNRETLKFGIIGVLLLSFYGCGGNSESKSLNSTDDLVQTDSEENPQPEETVNLITIKSQVSGEKYIDWGLPPVESDFGPTDPWTWTHGMCDGPWFENVGASSTLAQQGMKEYAAWQVCDDDPTTAWVEGNEEYGIGEFLEFIDWVPMGDGEISVLNGYQSSKKTWEDNSRVKKIKISIDGEDVCIVELADVMGVQTFTLPPENEGGIMHFTIMEVYPGLKWKDTAISGIFSCGG